MATPQPPCQSQVVALSANFKLFSRNCEQFRWRTILPTQERESEKKSLQQLSPFYPNVNNKSESPPNCRRALKFSTLKNFIKIFLFEQRLIKSSQVKKSLSGGKRKKSPADKSLPPIYFSPSQSTGKGK